VTNYLLLHGASSTGWIWYRVEPILREAGHLTLAPDLPCADPTADLECYIEAAMRPAAEAFGEAPLTVVGLSLAGMVAPVVAARRPVNHLVLVSAMIPRPGESAYQWATSTRQMDAQATYLDSLGLPTDDLLDPELIFLHDLDPQQKAESLNHVPEQHATLMRDPCPIETWPDIDTDVIAARDDRMFPLEFMRDQARDRLGIEPAVIPGGHLAPLTQPHALATQLLNGAAHHAV
jgi:pimeloyl-ACP methyl ester carboxylesterase